jgi:hypothetical protein
VDGYIRLDISLGREWLTPEACQWAAVVIHAGAGSTAAAHRCIGMFSVTLVSALFLISGQSAAHSLNSPSLLGMQRMSKWFGMNIALRLPHSPSGDCAPVNPR